MVQKKVLMKVIVKSFMIIMKKRNGKVEEQKSRIGKVNLMSGFKKIKLNLVYMNWKKLEKGLLNYDGLW